METYITAPQLPFRWRGKDYQLGPSGLRDNVAFAEVSPRNDTLVEELKRRIQHDKGLKLYLGFSYICFVEDYGGD